MASGTFQARTARVGNVRTPLRGSVKSSRGLLVSMHPPALEDLGRRGRAFLVLATLARKDGAVTMTEFTHASRLVPEVARMLREDLERWGLVQSEIIGRRGVVELLSIRLTPLGRDVATHVLALEERLRQEALRLRGSSTTRVG